MCRRLLSRNAMAKIDRERPELRCRDNLRRELCRIVEAWPDQSIPAGAPDFLKPFVAVPATMQALGKLLQAFNDYMDEPRQVFSMTPPEDAIMLRQACREFGQARMQNPYDRLYSVHDWLKDAVANPAATNPFYDWLLNSIVAS